MKSLIVYLLAPTLFLTGIAQAQENPGKETLARDDASVSEAQDPLPGTDDEPKNDAASVIEPDLPSDSVSVDAPLSKNRDTTANKAQSPSSPEFTFSDPIWDCELPNGRFSVRVADLISVSHHAYRLSGDARITETTVATRGSVLARFIHREPLPKTISVESIVSPLAKGQRALERAQSLIDSGRHLDRHSDDSDRLPIKDHDEAAHGRTILYQLPSKADVLSIYHNAYAAWKNRQSGRFRLGASD